MTEPWTTIGISDDRTEGTNDANSATVMDDAGEVVGPIHPPSSALGNCAPVAAKGKSLGTNDPCDDAGANEDNCRAQAARGTEGEAASSGSASRCLLETSGKGENGEKDVGA